MKSPREIEQQIRNLYDQQKGMNAGTLEDLWEICTFEVLAQYSEAEVRKYDNWVMNHCI